ncbi:PREDICTED: uncharacterized protein LOC109243954 [Nicotiana attenuata]|uniref:Uncharacterized protein n=1 Tax=Nicotiana attenuata TaxID=49451 RepID=A0A314L1T8_NICAT|nr:PREDICTED: uncharacterized protein LOC109243954 [Nicotiana attenuata]OIT34994.1 hypothetical protein A4A49_16049 [Nicotiana attenuata]
MSSILTSQGMVLATAMAVSGTMILLAALKLQKSADQFSFNLILHHPRSCISTDGKKKEKKKKRVKFAEDVVEPSGNSEEYRKLRCNNNFSHGNGHEASSSSNNSDSNAFKKSGKVQEMPANRAALYNSMLKGRVINRVTYSY